MKTVDEIYGDMMAVFAKETGLEAASSGDLSVRLYAVAAQIYGLYVQSDWVRRQCFPQTADGDYLEQHAFLRGVERRAEAKAEGNVTFFVDAATTTDCIIAAGTICMTAGLVRFETMREAKIEAGTLSAMAPARAMVAGKAGNVGAGSILTMAVAPMGVRRCLNTAAFALGAERETDELLRARVLETFRRLPNGANAAFYEQGAMSFGEVAAAKVLPRSRGVGTVDVVVATLAGAPNADLLEKMDTFFEARREIAVDVVVRAPTMMTVNMQVKVAAKAGVDAGAVQALVAENLRGYMSGKRLGEKLLRAKLAELIFHTEGVENYSLVSPAADVAVDSDALPQMGTLVVEAMV